MYVNLENFSQRLWSSIDSLECELRSSAADCLSSESSIFDDEYASINYCLDNLKMNHDDVSAYVNSPENPSAGQKARLLNGLLGSLRKCENISFETVRGFEELVGFVNNQMPQLSKSHLNQYILPYTQYKAYENQKEEKRIQINSFAKVIVKLRKDIRLTADEKSCLYDFIKNHGSMLNEEFHTRTHNNHVLGPLDLTLMSLGGQSQDGQYHPEYYCNFNHADLMNIQAIQLLQSQNADQPPMNLGSYGLFGQAPSRLQCSASLFMAPLAVAAIALIFSRNQWNNDFASVM